MQAQTLRQNGSDDRLLVFRTGDEVMRTLRDYAREHHVAAAHFQGIGAFASGVLAYFDWERREYLEIPVEEQVEVLVLSGDVAWQDDDPVIHAHAVLGRRDGSTIGGHLLRGIVRPTLELSFTVAGALRRRFDPESGLALIVPGPRSQPVSSP